MFLCIFYVYFSILVTKLQLNYDVLLIFEMLMCTGFQRCQLAILLFTVSVLLCDTVFGIFFVFFVILLCILISWSPVYFNYRGFQVNISAASFTFNR